MKVKMIIKMSCLVLLFSLSSAHAAQTLYQLGRSPFFTPPLKSVEDLQYMVENHSGEIQKGFELAGQGELYGPFIEQFPDAEITEVEFQKGEKLAWMFYKKDGKGPVKVTKDVTWGSDDPFTAYQFDIDYQEKRYTMVVPFTCGNLALKEISKAPIAVIPQEEALEAKENMPPTTIAFVLPERAKCNVPVKVDARKSKDEDGYVASVEVVVEDPNGDIAHQEVLEEKPFETEFPMPCGTSSVNITATDDMGLAGNTVSKDIVGVTDNEWNSNWVADVAFMRQFDPANYILARVGYEYYFNDTFSVLGLIGGAPKIRGNDGASAFILDVLASYNFDAAYISLGLGGWLTSGDSDNKLENSQLDVVADIGYRIFGEKDAFNTSLFVEARSGVEELNDMAKYGRFGVGLRFKF